METLLEGIKEALFFNDLLIMAGLKPEEVKIYRHKNEVFSLGQSLYTVCFDNPEEFLAFQGEQSSRNPFARDYVASFVETASGETLFVGIYNILKRNMQTSEDGSKWYQYDQQKTNHLSELSGRLFVNWDETYKARQSAICAENYNFKIIKMRGASEREAFPGFHDFVYPIADIKRMPEEWKNRLRDCRGIYLLTCEHSEKLYVGAAYGDNGFWGRWSNYCDTKDGGNKLLIEHNKECNKGYTVSILDIASSSDTVEEILKKERSWKKKLLTQNTQLGLNVN